MQLDDLLTRMVFFTGKGGVGKTSLACAAAIRLADGGRRVLLVSTDPASNLDDVLQTPLGSVPIAIPAVPLLSALNLDPRQAAADYRSRMVEPWKGVLPDSVIQSMEEQFSGACTVEIAAFEKFAALLADPQATLDYDFVIFDTAPTGHTLRLLALPAAWSGYLQQNTSGISCAGPLAGLKQQQELFQQSVLILRDPARCTCVLVARPDESSLREAARTSCELAEAGVRNQRLAINGVFRANTANDPLAVALESSMQNSLKRLPDPLRELPKVCFPFQPVGRPDPQWLRSLKEVECSDAAQKSSWPQEMLGPFQELVEHLAACGNGVILAMGKGGVGKTSVARAIAVALANRGAEVLLTTTDPAAHAYQSTLPNLHVAAIDPHSETTAYRQEVMEQFGAGLDDAGRALLEEDLRSPCTEEIAVFRAFAAAVASGTRQFVVIDTAPTGHTVLLLDAAHAFHREVQRQGRGLPESVQQLLPRLRDPAYTHILIVTLPEATPVLEAKQLQADLHRAGLQPCAWVVNQVFSGLSVTDSGLLARQIAEQPWLEEVRRQSTHVLCVPWSPAGFPEIPLLKTS